MEIIKFNDFMSGNYGKHRYEKVEVPLVAESAAKDYEVISMLGDLSVTLVRVVLILFAVKFGLGFAIAFIHAMMPMPIGGV